EQPVAREAGVVDEDVEVARFLDEPGRLLRARDVGLDGAAADPARQLLRLLASGAVADDDARAGARELLGDRAADPLRGARDERRLPLEGGEAQWSLPGARRCSGERKPSSARMRGAFIADAMEATEDAAMRRACSRMSGGACPRAATTRFPSAARGAGRARPGCSPRSPSRSGRSA